MSGSRFYPPYWKLVQAFLREATEDESFEPLPDTTDGFAMAYAKLRSLQRGHFETTIEEGRVMISSTVANKQFSFQVPDGLSSGDIMAIAETTLELLTEAGTISQARTLLRRRKTTRPDFSRLII